MMTKQYYLRRDGKESGPWSINDLRRYLFKSGDPDPDYEIRVEISGAWTRASQLPELSDMFNPYSMTARTTKGESPSGKTKKQKSSHG